MIGVLQKFRLNWDGMSLAAKPRPELRHNNTDA